MADWNRAFEGMSLKSCYGHLEILKKINFEPALIACKRRIRKLTKDIGDDLNGKRIIHEYGVDGYIYREPLNAATKEEAEKEFDRNHRIDYRPTYYDCTGQMFTGWHRIFRINGKYVLYHKISFDV